MKEAIINTFSKANNLRFLTKKISLQGVDSKLIFLLQVLSFGFILFLLPLEYPTFYVKIDLQSHHAFSGAWSTFLNQHISIFPSNILIFIIALFTFNKWIGKLISDNSKYLVIFLLSIAITFFSTKTPFPTDLNHKFYNILLMTILFSITVYFIEENAKTKLHLFFVIILLMSLFQGILACIQYFTQAPAGLHKFETFSLFVSTFGMPTKKLWLFDNIFKITRNSDTVARAYGTLTHSNVYGGFILFSSFFTYYFFYSVKGRLKEIVFGLVIFFQFFSICLSFSRAAIMAYMIGAALWFFFFFLKRMKEFRDTAKLRRLALWIGFSVLLCFILFYEQFMHRGGIINYNKFVATAADIPRLKSILTSFKIIQDHAFFGVGLENSYQFFPGATAALGLGNSFICFTHNIYLIIAMETGIIGVCFFLLFIGTTLQKALAALTPLSLSLFCTFSTLLFIGCCDFYLWRFPSGQLMFFITAGMIVGLYNFLLKTKRRKEMRQVRH